MHAKAAQIAAWRRSESRSANQFQINLGRRDIKSGALQSKLGIGWAFLRSTVGTALTRFQKLVTPNLSLLNAVPATAIRVYP
jgi:hypothetical protein